MSQLNKEILKKLRNGKLFKAKEAGKKKKPLSGDVINTADDVSYWYWSQLEKTGKLEGNSNCVSLNKIFVHNDEMLEGLTKRTSAVQR